MRKTPRQQVPEDEQEIKIRKFIQEKREQSKALKKVLDNLKPKGEKH